MMESNNVLGENIKKKMEEKNLTTFELADRHGSWGKLRRVTLG